MLMQEYLLTYYTKPVISTIISFQTVICLTPHALENPVEVTQEEYDKLVHMKERGWSHCNSKEEFLAKLLYLRGGLPQGKINAIEFLEREKKLVIHYWNRGS